MLGHNIRELWRESLLKHSEAVGGGVEIVKKNVSAIYEFKNSN